MARAVEPYANISAQDLLSAGASCFGWVMKENTSGLRSLVKALGWPWYYMILHSGCLYLYERSDGQNYLEAIPLTKYRACDAQEVTRYPWTFKLINESYAMKTLIFAVDSEFDLQHWQEAITEDRINYCCPISDAPSCPQENPSHRLKAKMFPRHLKPPCNPTDVAPISTETTTVHSKPQTNLSTPVSLHEPKATRKQRPLPSLPGQPQENRTTRPQIQPISGPHHEPKSILTPKRPQGLKQNKPQTQQYPLNPIQRTLHEAETPAGPPVRSSSRPAISQGHESVKMTSSCIATPLGSSSQTRLQTPGFDHALEQLVVRRNVPSDFRCSSRSSLIAGGSTPPKSKTLGRGAPEGRSFKEKHREANISSLTLIHDMDSSQANLLLQNKCGVYILRKSQTKQSTTVLSVGTGDKVVHYRIFYDEKQGYSLSEHGGPRFHEIEDLLSYYSSFNLPTHDVKLTVAASYK